MTVTEQSAQKRSEASVAVGVAGPSPMPKSAAADAPKTAAAAPAKETAKTAAVSDRLVSDAVARARPDTRKDAPATDTKDATAPADETASPVPPSSADKPTTAATTTPRTDSEPTPRTTEKRGSIFWPLLLGGIVAGIIGFLASELDVLGTRGVDETPELRAALAEQQDRIAALETAEPAPTETPPTADGASSGLDDLTTQVAALQEELTTLSDRVGAFDDRLTTLEQRPVADNGSDEAAAAYEQQLNALRGSVEQQSAEIQQQSTEIQQLLSNARSVEEATAAAARQSTVQSALATVTTAIGNGTPFEDGIATLQGADVQDIPGALTENAETGVATLSSLQARYPDAARAALSEARANGLDDANPGFTGFLRQQLGARSTAPRAGDDPDAVLSRAESALRDGQLADALAEIDTLPDIVQTAMDTWLSDARARQSATRAVQDLSDRLTATQGN